MVKNSRTMGLSRADRIFNWLLIILCILAFLLFAYPLYFILIASISDPFDVWNGLVTVVPRHITLIGYNEILTYPYLLRSYMNSLFYVVVGTLMSLLLTTTGAYVLGRKEFVPRQLIMSMLLFTMFFNGGLIPNYLLVRDLHLLNTIWAILLPGMVSVTNLIITRTYYATNIPEELHEAAQLDGCNDFRYFVSIVLPLSRTIIAVMALYYGVARWNAYFNAMIYLSDRNIFPLQLVLREILNRTIASMEVSGNDLEQAKQMRLAEVSKYCAIVISSLPPMLLYPLVQKHFVKGVMIGSVKG